MPSVFNLSSRKKDFQSLVKNFSEIFLESTDPTVLSNCAVALTSLASGEHARISDAQLGLKKTVNALQNRLLELLEVKVGILDSTDEDKTEASPFDTEHSIGLCLRRLDVLSKRVYIGKFLLDSADTEQQDEVVENLFNTVAEYVAKELNSRKVVYPEEEGEESSMEIPDIWNNGNERLPELVAEAVSEALSFLLCTTAWRLNSTIENLGTENDPSDKPEEHIVVRMRDQLVKLVYLCFEQFLESEDEGSFTKEHIVFSQQVQKVAGRTAGDIRSLFPRAWESSESPLLRAFAFVEDGPVIGGFVRFLRSQDAEVRVCGSTQLLPPLLFTLTTLLLCSISTHTATDPRRRRRRLS